MEHTVTVDEIIKVQEKYSGVTDLNTVASEILDVLKKFEPLINKEKLPNPEDYRNVIYELSKKQIAFLDIFLNATVYYLAKTDENAFVVIRELLRNEIYKNKVMPDKLITQYYVDFIDGKHNGYLIIKFINDALLSDINKEFLVVLLYAI